MKPCHNRYRALSRLVQGEPSGNQGYLLIFASYEIPVSSTVYSTELIEARDRVDGSFNHVAASVVRKLPCGSSISCFDSSGHEVCSNTPRSIDIMDIMDLLSTSSHFKTLELGCCRTYSHRLLKTRCLTCLIVISGEAEEISTIRSNVRQTLSNNSRGLKDP